MKTQTALPAPSALHLLSRFTAFFAFFVLVAGGMVTSTGSGQAVPDWPLSFGQYMPRMVGGVFFQHGHRVVAGIVTVLTWILMGLVLVRDSRRWVRRTAVAAAVGVLLQAVLGGVTVLYGLPPQVSIIHACLGQALFCALAIIAQATSPSYLADGLKPSSSLWYWGLLAAGAVFVQLILGAVMRHASVGLDLHLLWALVAATTVCYPIYLGLDLASGYLPLQGLSRGMAGLILLQLFLGIASFWVRSERVIAFSSVLPTAHQACGALILVSMVLWTLRAHRRAA